MTQNNKREPLTRVSRRKGSFTESQEILIMAKKRPLIRSWSWSKCGSSTLTSRSQEVWCKESIVDFTKTMTGRCQRNVFQDRPPCKCTTSRKSQPHSISCKFSNWWDFCMASTTMSILSAILRTLSTIFPTSVSIMTADSRSSSKMSSAKYSKLLEHSMPSQLYIMMNNLNQMTTHFGSIFTTK